MRRITYTVIARGKGFLASLTVSPRPGVGNRAIAYSKRGIAVVQALSSRELASKALRRAEALGPRRAIEVILKDPKAGYRQALVVTLDGRWAAFTGMGTVPEKGHKRRANLYCTGNGLKRGTLDALCSVKSDDPLEAVLLAALEAESAGGNLWPSRSASLVIVGPTALKLDVYSSDDPVFDIMTKVKRLSALTPSLLY